MNDRLEIRKNLYLSLLSGTCPSGLILLVGDKPGPSAPTNSGYHHTPFYSMKHCSGWLNKQLDEWAIEEQNLLWINAVPAPQTTLAFDALLVRKVAPRLCIALGGVAERWLKSGGFEYKKMYHPQYWKRFRNKQPYPLFELLAQLT